MKVKPSRHSRKPVSWSKRTRCSRILHRRLQRQPRNRLRQMMRPLQFVYRPPSAPGCREPNPRALSACRPPPLTLKRQRVARRRTRIRLNGSHVRLSQDGRPANNALTRRHDGLRRAAPPSEKIRVGPSRRCMEGKRELAADRLCVAPKRISSQRRGPPSLLVVQRNRRRSRPGT
jgi:hypothetical protein